MLKYQFIFRFCSFSVFFCSFVVLCCQLRLCTAKVKECGPLSFGKVIFANNHYFYEALRAVDILSVVWHEALWGKTAGGDD